ARLGQNNDTTLSNHRAGRPYQAELHGVRLVGYEQFMKSVVWVVEFTLRTEPSIITTWQPLEEKQFGVPEKEVGTGNACGVVPAVYMHTLVTAAVPPPPPVPAAAAV